MEVLRGGVGVNALEIGLHALKKGDFLPIFHEHLLLDGDVFLLCFDQHQVHVGKHLVHVVFLRQLIGLLPKLPLIHVEVGDEVVLLHVSRRERPIEIVGDSHISIFCNHLIISSLLFVCFTLFITAKIVIISIRFMG